MIYVIYDVIAGEYLTKSDFETDKGLKEAKNFHDRYKYLTKDRFYSEYKEEE